MKYIIFLLLIISGAMFLAPPTMDSQNNKTIRISWSKEDSKAYARDKLSEWQDEQWACLSRLWSKESAWNPSAYNSIRVQGKHAGGIPQLLGLDPKISAPLQIDRGLRYIYYRYDTPCLAWKHFVKYGWH